MEVMRANHEALLTILEVLLYDPLYAWTLSPQKAYALQQLRDRQDHDTANLDATTIDIMDISLPSTDTSKDMFIGRSSLVFILRGVTRFAWF